MNFEEYKENALERLMKVKNHTEFVAMCEAIKVELILNFINVDELLKGK